MNKKIIIALPLALIALGFVIIKTTGEDTPIRQEQLLSQVQDASIGTQEESLPSQEQNNTPENETQTTLYYGITCSYCKIVEEWLEENIEIKEKSNIVAKEVYNNQENSKELLERTEECQIGENSGIGVPFLYDNGECIIGSQPIINHLKERYE